MVVSFIQQQTRWSNLKVIVVRRFTMHLQAALYVWVCLRMYKHVYTLTWKYQHVCCVNTSRNIIRSVADVRSCSKVCVKTYWINTFCAIKFYHLQRQVLMLQEYIHTVNSVSDWRSLERVCVPVALLSAFDYSFRSSVLLLLICWHQWFHVEHLLVYNSVCKDYFKMMPLGMGVWEEQRERIFLISFV